MAIVINGTPQAEAVSVEWNEIDLNKKIWVIPEENEES